MDMQLIKVEKKTSDFLDFFILFLMIENKKHTKISLFSLSLFQDLFIFLFYYMIMMMMKILK